MKRRYNEGFIMIITIMVSLVLFIGAGFIITFMVNENHQSLYQEQKKQAYYIARAGVVATEEAILKMDDYESEKLLERLEKSTNPLKVTIDDMNFDNAEVQVKIEKIEGTNNLKIISIGKVKKRKNINSNHVENTVTKVMVGEKNQGSGIDSDYAIFAGNRLVISGKPNIRGDVGIKKDGSIMGEDNIKFKKGGKVLKDQDKTYPLLTPPNLPQIDKEDNSSKVNNIKESVEYISENVTFDNLIINTNNQDIDIVVNSVILNKDLDIRGSGKVRLFITNNLKFKGNGHINKGNSFEQLEVYYYSNQALTIKDVNNIYGNIFIEGAPVFVESNTHINGNIFSNASWVGYPIDISANIKVCNIYAPKALIRISGNADISGGIFGDSIEISGNSDIEGYISIEIPPEILPPDSLPKVVFKPSHFE